VSKVLVIDAMDGHKHIRQAFGRHVGVGVGDNVPGSVGPGSIPFPQKNKTAGANVFGTRCGCPEELPLEPIPLPIFREEGRLPY
jgi:hypothetical protein